MKICSQLIEFPNNALKSNLSGNEVSRSDSMIPLVGDSILVQDITMDNKTEQNWFVIEVTTKLVFNAKFHISWTLPYKILVCTFLNIPKL